MKAKIFRMAGIIAFLPVCVTTGFTTDEENIIRIVDMVDAPLGSAFSLGALGPVITARHVLPPGFPSCAELAEGSPSNQFVKIIGAYQYSMEVRCAHYHEPLKFSYQDDKVESVAFELASLEIDVKTFQGWHLRHSFEIALDRTMQAEARAIGWPTNGTADEPEIISVRNCNHFKNYPAAFCKGAESVRVGVSGGPLVFGTGSGARIGGVNVFVYNSEYQESSDPLENAYVRIIERESSLEDRRTGYALLALQMEPVSLIQLMSNQEKISQEYYRVFEHSIRSIAGKEGDRCRARGRIQMLGNYPAPPGVIMASSAALISSPSSDSQARLLLMCASEWLTLFRDRAFEMMALRYIFANLCHKSSELSEMDYCDKNARASRFVASAADMLGNEIGYPLPWFTNELAIMNLDLQGALDSGFQDVRSGVNENARELVVSAMLVAQHEELAFGDSIIGASLNDGLALDPSLGRAAPVSLIAGWSPSSRSWRLVELAEIAARSDAHVSPKDVLAFGAHVALEKGSWTAHENLIRRCRDISSTESDCNVRPDWSPPPFDK